MDKLKDKVVLITGASSGIGAILAELVVANGATPILLARSEDKLVHVTEIIYKKYNKNVPYYICDVSRLEQVQAVFNDIISSYPMIDILVNSAGYGIFQSFTLAPEEEFEQIMKVNYLGTVYCCKQVLPSMIEKGKGHIINVASQAGKIATAKSTAYTASKHAVLGFTNSLRMELQDTPIQITAVNPGPIRTPFFDLADQSGDYVKNIDKYMLDPTYVAQRILQTMLKPQRELNLPRWMDTGSRLFQLFPQTMERITKNLLNKK